MRKYLPYDTTTELKRPVRDTISVALYNAKQQTRAVRYGI
jgi:hypothetical protein